MAKKSPIMRFFELNMGPHDALFAQLPSRELVRLMQTCRLIRNLAHEVCFSLTRLLVPFFGDRAQVDRFRQIQADTGTLISGSMALQFLERTTYPGSDLDLYAYKAHAERPVAFILENGYVFKPRAQKTTNVIDDLFRDLEMAVDVPQKPDVFDHLCSLLGVSHRVSRYPANGIVDMLEFTKGDKKIQLMLAKASPVEVILDFHSTVVMNLISHASAYSLYPWSTFVTKRAVQVGYSMTSREEGRQKYIDRGWQMSSSAPTSTEFQGLRWVGDRHTWTLPLPLPAKASKTDFATGNSWKFDPQTHLHDIAGTQLGCGHPHLRFSYFVAGLPRDLALDLMKEAVKNASLFPQMDADFHLLVLLMIYRETHVLIEREVKSTLHELGFSVQ
ncbi:hypothetical protein FB45DRAFT_1143097 [Roridomyces roridus]|uniref:Uncharacterized protein n=1 Tax=Roridomyces roridus TaxID=1738132 RepID=A0AAD7BZV6_9AGAR|nr:hypothetical protein FB45DRAFT_830711 [Roridomyces roridus]KAJ7635135.1 hypothetical protein FB45DRAFT_1143097 [Roridomyces roridus]